jgi:class 3 adenylate cyclase
VPNDAAVSNSAVGRTEEYRRRKQTSVLAIAFADIVGSTNLLESMGEGRYGSLLDDHKARVDAVVSRDDAGSVVQFVGDGALAVFAEPSISVERCLELSRSTEGFSLRIGIDLGQVATRSAGGTVAEVFGRHVYRASRIQAEAQAGEVLVSFQVYDCAVGWLRETPISWDDRGVHTLKGFNEPVHLFNATDRVDGLLEDPTDFSMGGIARKVLRVPEPDRDELRRRPAATNEDSLLAFGSVGATPGSIGARFAAGSVFQPRMSSGPRDPLSFADFPLMNTLELKIEGRARSLMHGSGSRARRPGVLGVFDRSTRRRASATIKPTLLWVDDFPENNGALSDYLQRHGFEIECAADTEPALKVLGQRRFAAIITDMGRPSSPSAGLDLLRALNQRNDHTPVIVYASTRSVSVYGQEAKELGAHTATSGAVTLFEAIASIPEGVRAQPSP